MSKKPSQATLLVDLAADIELFQTPEQIAYASVTISNHKEIMLLKESLFKNYLARLFYKEYGKTPNTQALQSAVGVLTGRALYDSPTYPVFTRVAEHEGKIYIDLGNKKWEAIEITKNEWRIVQSAPVKFRRSRGMLPLPYPKKGGDINDLKAFLNFGQERSFTLIVGWLVAALSPQGPYTILALHGEHGSAKSTTARVLRALLDPNKVPLRSEPRDSRDLMIAANNSWCLVFDNLSFIKNQLSDDLCRIATGGGFTTRELYTNEDEAMFEAKRPVLINGIEELATRPDLLDRSLIIYLPRISEEDRRTERDFWKDFKFVHPYILGTLLDAAATALRNLGKVEVGILPRMADFTEWVVAAEESFGWEGGTFLKAYKENQLELNELSLESSVIAKPIIELVDKFGIWEGTATDLRDELGGLVDDETKKKQNGWPKNARLLSNYLRRITPNLRTVGIAVDFRKSGERKIHIESLKSDVVDAKDDDFPTQSQIASTVS
jgi:hypothetical protein